MTVWLTLSSGLVYFFLFDSRRPRTGTAYDETDLQTPESETKQQARLPHPHGDPGGASGPVPPQEERPEAADRAYRRQVLAGIR